MLSTHGYFDPVPQLGRTDTGGQVVYVLQLARALAALDIGVDIYTRWFDPSKKQTECLPDCPEVRVIRIPAGPWNFIRKEEIYDVLPELAKNMIGFIQENQLSYDLFHGHYVDAGIVTLEVANAFERPAFFTAHSLGAWKREQMGGEAEEMDKKYKFSHRIAEETQIFKSVTAQTVTSDLQKKKLEQLYGLRLGNVAVIPPGVDARRFRPHGTGKSKAKTGLPNRYMFCLSRIDANKGHDLLLGAFDLVRRTMPDIHLVIGGGSPKPQPTEAEILATIRQVIDEKEMQARVHVVGYVPEELLVPAYQNSEFFVLPSIFEPFGMTALEAMACGKPVVASKLGGIRRLISPPKNGLLVDPRNLGEFADAMIMLLRDQGMAQSMGQEARRTVETLASWEAIAARHLTFYETYCSLVD